MTLAQKELYSKILIWIGVLAWAPYIVLRLFAKDVSGIPFLIVHLTGVLGGLTFRNQFSKHAAPLSQKIIQLKKISTILLVVGVGVWALYFSLEILMGHKLNLTPFLIAHLSFILSGAGIKLYIFMGK